MRLERNDDDRNENAYDRQIRHENLLTKILYTVKGDIFSAYLSTFRGTKLTLQDYTCAQTNE